MTVKEYLNQYLILNKRIQLLDQQIAEVEAEMERVTAELDGMPHGTGLSDKVGELATTLADLKWDLTDMRTEAWKVKARVMHTILSVDNEDYQQVLMLRYVEDMHWQAIADEMYYTRRWVTTLHGRALEYLRSKTGMD